MKDREKESIDIEEVIKEKYAMSLSIIMTMLCCREALQSELEVTRLKVDTLQLKKNIAESKVPTFSDDVVI